jgi:hypothetical protein
MKSSISNRAMTDNSRDFGRFVIPRHYPGSFTTRSKASREVLNCDANSHIPQGVAQESQIVMSSHYFPLSDLFPLTVRGKWRTPINGQP